MIYVMVTATKPPYTITLFVCFEVDAAIVCASYHVLYNDDHISGRT